MRYPHQGGERPKEYPVGMDMKVLKSRMEKFNDRLLMITRYVEETLEKSTTALFERDVDLLNNLENAHLKIDFMCTNLEEEAISLLGLFSPVGQELRVISMGLKISSALKEIGHFIADMVDRSKLLLKLPKSSIDDKVKKMATIVIEMIRESILSYIELDIDLAKGVCKKDDLVDRLYDELKTKLMKGNISSSNEFVKNCTLAFLISVIERIGDQATSIAEATYYIATGEVRRCFSDKLEVLSEKLEERKESNN